MLGWLLLSQADITIVWALRHGAEVAEHGVLEECQWPDSRV